MVMKHEAKLLSAMISLSYYLILSVRHGLSRYVATLPGSVAFFGHSPHRSDQVLLKVIGYLFAQVFQRLANDLLDLVQHAPSSYLPSSTNNLSPITRHNPEVSPSAALESSAPSSHGLVPSSIGAIPRVEGTRNKALFRHTLDDRIRKDVSPRILASLSAGPLHKVHKEWFAGFCRLGDGSFQVAVSAVGCQVDVLDGSQLDGLLFFRLAKHRSHGCGGVVVE